ncbi:MAG: DUF3365 domain-containing protein [Xenococcaceae cyanobacterium]
MEKSEQSFIKLLKSRTVAHSLNISRRMNSINTNLQLLKLRTIFLIALAVAIFFTAVSCGGQTQQKTVGLSPDVVADYIHKVIQSDRTVYSKHVINRLNDKYKLIQASENWQEDKALPLPAQMLRMGAELSSKEGSFSYGLISPWNINDDQAPKSKFEKEAMNTVLKTGLPFKGYQQIAGKKYFSALYPDKAVAPACINCHNSHPVHKQRYPEKTFEMGEVMGGIYINVPMTGR